VKRWLRRITPNRAQVREHKQLRAFGKRLQDPALWHLNRQSVSGAFAVGMFVMYLPPLGQLLIAAAGAIAFRVNLPISVALPVEISWCRYSRSCVSSVTLYFFAGMGLPSPVSGS